MATPVTTLVPFTSLPACALQCGPLYDANGACVPPNVAAADEATYDKCFCQHPKLQPFSTATAGVCDTACTADPAGLGSIQGWFTGLCQGKGVATTTSSGSSSTKGASSGAASSGGGGSWLSNHWQWVIMIVVIVVGIAGIWVGACIWRRKYLKKKDRMYELGKGLPSTVAVNTQGKLVGPGANRGPEEAGMFMSGSGAGVDEKPKKERKRWNVRDRT